jgi:predicted DNA-binding transcriptional regulator AlpA
MMERQMTQTDYVTRQDLPALGIKYSRQWLYALEERGQFPKRIRFSPRRHFWLRSDIERWLAERHAAVTPTVPPVLDPFKGQTRPQDSIRQGDHDERTALA